MAASSLFGSTKPAVSSGSVVSPGSGMEGPAPVSKAKSASPRCVGPHLLRLFESNFIAQHDQVVNAPIALAGAKAMKPDLALFIHIYHKIVLGVGMQWAWGAISIQFNLREPNTKQHFSIVDDGIDGRSVLMGFHRISKLGIQPLTHLSLK